MDASQFTLWLQGFAELNAAPPTQEQWQSIREHLQLVFKKVTPEVKAPTKNDGAKEVDLAKVLEEYKKKVFAPHTPWPFIPPSNPPRYILRNDDIKPGTIIC
jgi:hypothetical protein